MCSDATLSRRSLVPAVACACAMALLSGCGVFELVLIGGSLAAGALTPKPPEQTELAVRSFRQQANEVCPELGKALDQDGRKGVDANEKWPTYRFSYPAPPAAGVMGGTLRAACQPFEVSTIVTVYSAGPPDDAVALQAANRLLDDLQRRFAARGIDAGPPHQTHRLMLSYDAATVYAALMPIAEADGRTIAERDPAAHTLRVTYPFSLLRNNWGGTLTIVCVAKGAYTVITITGDGHDVDSHVSRIGDEIVRDLTKALRQLPRTL